MNAPEDALAILAEHEDITYNLGTPREYTQHGGWNKSCGCGEHLCSHPDGCDCHRAHVAQVLAEWVAGEKARAFNEGVIAQREATRAARGTVGRIVYANPYETCGDWPAPCNHDPAHERSDR